MSKGPDFRAIMRISGPSSSKENGGEWGIRTPEGLHPTRFPSVRHRPLGEFSWVAFALRATAHNILADAGAAVVHGLPVGAATLVGGSPRGAIQANSPRAETQQG